ncbi:MAG: hypothetical protein HQ492_02380 [Woeseiaceae bacterium]|nr:hypothetical protein [Woeseiaceae bacterium]
MSSSRLIFCAMFCMVGIDVSADSEAMPMPKVFAARTNAFYFKLIPAADFDEEKSEGFLYRVTDTVDELVYRSDGWYSFDVFVSYDGSYLARSGPWPRHDSPPETMPAVVFYADGKPVKTYYVSDLVKDELKLQHSISHYSWGNSLRWAEDYSPDILEVRTVEDRTIKFDIRSADIVGDPPMNAN